MDHALVLRIELAGQLLGALLQRMDAGQTLLVRIPVQRDR
jgi:hypothetical protein